MLKKIILNLLATSFLTILIMIPVIFAKSISKVEGVQDTKSYLLISRIDQFPNLNFKQHEDTVEISFSKVGPQQAFIAPISIFNPTDSKQKYQIRVTSGSAKVFFGDNYQDTLDEVTVPVGTSVSISIFSGDGQLGEQSVKFKIDYK